MFIKHYDILMQYERYMPEKADKLQKQKTRNSKVSLSMNIKRNPSSNIQLLEQNASR